MFSKKATKIDKIFTVDLTLTYQIDSEDFVNALAFLKNMNFKELLLYSSLKLHIIEIWAIVYI